MLLELETHNVPYDRVLELDRQLRSAYGGISDSIRVDRLPLVSTDATLTVASRLALANNYRKGLCTLHSKCLEAAATSRQYLYSRLACVDCAMLLLKYDAYQHQEHHHNGQKDPLNKHQTSLTTHDYFLAATILCTILALDPKSPDALVVDPEKVETVQTIEGSLATFEDVAQKAAMLDESAYLLRTFSERSSIHLTRAEATHSQNRLRSIDRLHHSCISISHGSQESAQRYRAAASPLSPVWQGGTYSTKR